MKKEKNNKEELIKSDLRIGLNLAGVQVDDTALFILTKLFLKGKKLGKTTVKDMTNIMSEALEKYPIKPIEPVYNLESISKLISEEIKKSTEKIIAEQRINLKAKPKKAEFPSKNK